MTRSVAVLSDAIIIEINYPEVVHPESIASDACRERSDYKTMRGAVDGIRT